MSYLKIKDNVDLKELEKFGYKEFEISFIKDYSKDLFIRIIIETRIIQILDKKSGIILIDKTIIQDLIKADLVEEVKER